MFFLLLACTIQPPPASAAAPRLVVHEWGTFTSVVTAAGTALDYQFGSEPSDLPGFVHTYESRPRPKGPAEVPVGTVRMETPVVYVYADQPMDLTFVARFDVPGVMTEWYPAAAARHDRVGWKVKVDPVQSQPLPREAGASHYYPARIPSSAMLTAGNGEYDSLLFYRGIATFPLAPVRLEGEVLHTAGMGVVVQREGARLRMAPAAPQTRLPLPETTLAQAEATLVDMLDGAGLTGEEARAMMEVWDDTWFEEGVRVLTIQSRAETDRVMPLTIVPQPDELERVMVGRVEVLTPAILAEAGRMLRADPARGPAQVRARWPRAGSFALRAIQGES